MKKEHKILIGFTALICMVTFFQDSILGLFKSKPTVTTKTEELKPKKKLSEKTQELLIPEALFPTQNSKAPSPKPSRPSPQQEIIDEQTNPYLGTFIPTNEEDIAKQVQAQQNMQRNAYFQKLSKEMDELKSKQNELENPESEETEELEEVPSIENQEQEDPYGLQAEPPQIEEPLEGQDPFVDPALPEDIGIIPDIENMSDEEVEIYLNQ
jgi:hypothetical protein